MHELAVTQGVLDVALDAARRNGAQRITAIDLVIGELTGIVDDSVQFYFDIVSRDTLASGAKLRFSRAPGRGRCGDCGTNFAATPPIMPVCPQCGGGHLHITGGREFFVQSIEVEDEDPGGQGDSERE